MRNKRMRSRHVTKRRKSPKSSTHRRRRHTTKRSGSYRASSSRVNVLPSRGNITLFVGEELVTLPYTLLGDDRLSVTTVRSTQLPVNHLIQVLLNGEVHNAIILSQQGNEYEFLLQQHFLPARPPSPVQDTRDKRKREEDPTTVESERTQIQRRSV